MGGNWGTTRTRHPGPPPRTRSRFGHGSPGSVFPRCAPRAAAGLSGPSSLMAGRYRRQIPANSWFCKISLNRTKNTFPARTAVRQPTSDRFAEGQAYGKPARAAARGGCTAPRAARGANGGPSERGRLKKLNLALPGVLNPERSHLPSPRYAPTRRRRWLRGGSFAHLGLRKHCWRGREAGWQGRGGKQIPGATKPTCSGGESKQIQGRDQQRNCSRVPSSARGSVPTDTSKNRNVSNQHGLGLRLVTQTCVVHLPGCAPCHQAWCTQPKGQSTVRHCEMDLWAHEAPQRFKRKVFPASVWRSCMPLLQLLHFQFKN